MEGTQNRGIILKEYGRNIQKIVDYLLSITDREKRTRFAYTLIELMKQINPNIKDAQDNAQKIWDHLYIMSDFRLEVDCEYPMPEKSILGKKPMKVDYNTHNLKFKHYGRNVELLIEKAIALDESEEKDAAILYIGKLMKRFYAAWNKENIEDELIAEQLKLISAGKLTVDLEKVKAYNLFDSQVRDKDYSRPNVSSGSSSGGSNGGGRYEGGGRSDRYESGNRGDRYESGSRGDRYESGGRSDRNDRNDQGSRNNQDYRKVRKPLPQHRKKS
jgi:hypothetical protein